MWYNIDVEGEGFLSPPLPQSVAFSPLSALAIKRAQVARIRPDTLYQIKWGKDTAQTLKVQMDGARSFEYAGMDKMAKSPPFQGGERGFKPLCQYHGEAPPAPLISLSAEPLQ